MQHYRVIKVTLRIVLRQRVMITAMTILAMARMIFLTTPTGSWSAWLYDDIAMVTSDMGREYYLEREDGDGDKADNERGDHHGLVELEIPHR